MRKTIFLFGLIGLFFLSCVPDDEINKGTITVYSSKDTGGGVLTVFIDDQEIGDLNYIVDNPSCKDEYGVFKENLSFGTHSVQWINEYDSLFTTEVNLQTECLILNVNQ
jgi:hypothetical protein